MLFFHTKRKCFHLFLIQVRKTEPSDVRVKIFVWRLLDWLLKDSGFDQTNSFISILNIQIFCSVCIVLEYLMDCNEMW